MPAPRRLALAAAVLGLSGFAAVAGVSRDDVTGRVGLIYAVNTAGAVSGSMAAAFITIPLAGLQATLQLACACLIAAALTVAGVALTARKRTATLVPREIHRQSGATNGATLRALLAGGGGPVAMQAALAAATAHDWCDRGRMLAGADVHTRAYDDFVRALSLDSDDAVTLEGFVRSATLLGRASDALAALQTAGGTRTPTTARRLARARLLAADGAPGDALATAREAARLDPARPEPLEQIASLVADTGDRTALAAAVTALADAFPDRASTAFPRAVQAFLGGDAATALAHAERVIALDPSFAPVYHLAGAVLTALDQPDRARWMFERSLTFDAHDSTAYTNLGVLALDAGQRDEAASRFAEALWLNAADATARQGLSRALGR